MTTEEIVTYVVYAGLGGLIAYLWRRLEKRDESAVELEKRVAKLELSEAASSSAKEDLQELKKDLKELITSVTNLRIEMAGLSKGNKENG
jgi:K+-sensing histidine kinase KdpD